MKILTKILALLVIISLMLTPLSISAKTKYKNYNIQLTKQEKRLKKKVLKELRKNPEKKSFKIKKGYKSPKNLITIRKLAIKKMRQLIRVYSAISLDYPEYYWVGGESGLSFVYTVRKYEVKLLYNNNLSHKKSNVKAFNKNLKRIVGQIKKQNPKTKREKIECINTWMCENLKYSLNSSYAYTAYGAVVNKKAVCDGFASLFKILCKKFKIPCMKIRGRGLLNSGKYGNHSWNLVYINSKWLGIDTTWNNTTKNKEHSFLQNKSTFIKTHKKIKENGIIEGFVLDGANFKFKTLKSAF